MSETKPSKEPEHHVRANLTIPPDACDCHAHIFPDRSRYPAVNAGMALAPVELYLDVHQQLGFGRGVLVQGGAYKFDNTAMLDALDAHGDRLRGVARLRHDVTPQLLADYARRNVVALRFTNNGASKIDDLEVAIPAIKAAGMHVETYIGLESFVERSRDILSHGVPIVLDHLAGPFDPAIGIDAPAFEALLGLMQDHDIWVKLTPQRNSADFPLYRDVRPFHDALVATRPDRLVWGSDWPFPKMGDATPGLGGLLDLFGDWVTDPALRQQILVDNPRQLYHF